MKKHQETFDEEVTREWKHLKRLMSKNENHLLFTGFVMIMTAAVVTAGIYVFDNMRYTSHKDDNRQVIQLPKTTLYSTLDTFKNDFVSIRITNVYETAEADKAFAILDDQTFLIFNVEITNLSSGDQDLYPVNQFYARDRQGITYSMHPSMHVTTPLESGAMKPGEVRTGQISFAVPKALARPLFYADLGWDDMLPPVFDIMK
jgi:hypothetical protein